MNLFKKSVTVLAGALVMTTMTLEAAHARPNRGHGRDQGRGDIERRGPGQERTLYLTPEQRFYSGRNNPNNRAKLKQLILRQYPRLQGELQDMKLVSVTVVGRSASPDFATSTLNLFIANELHDRGSIGRTRRRGVDYETLHARRGRQEQGPWQVQFQGRTEVDSIEVVIERRRGGGPGGDRPGRLGRSLGRQKVSPNPFASDTDVYTAPRGGVQGDTISIRSNNGRIAIEDVKVTFANGRTRHLDELRGRLSAGHGPRSTAQASLRNERNIVKITVQARALEFTFPEPELEVFVK